MKKLDISGPKGNAFYVLSVAKNLAEQYDLDKCSIVKEMTAGHYDNLLRVFNSHFGSVVQLVSPYIIDSINRDLYIVEDYESDYI